jgi:putative hemin transport protein
MSGGTETTVRNSPVALREAWEALRAAEPMLRVRDAAERLGVSEAELVASRCGAGVTRLAGPWQDVVHALPALGEVMALTRNPNCVHEKTGTYRNVETHPVMGLVLDEAIDLRLFFKHWHHGFAVEEELRSGFRRSLQFFDCDGTAVHKVFLTEASAGDAYEALVARFRHPDQAPGVSVEPAADPLPGGTRDDEIDREELRARWRALRDPHDFVAMLRKLKLSRLQALRLAGQELAWEVGADALRRTLNAVADAKLPIMVFVGSPGVVQIHTGEIATVRPTGPWLNVLDPGFNLHLREDRIASAWVVTKPSPEGPVTSLEAYDRDGRQIVQLFGKRKPGIPEREDWRALVRALPRWHGHA